jgi:hypothetical protein
VAVPVTARNEGDIGRLETTRERYLGQGRAAGWLLDNLGSLCTACNRTVSEFVGLNIFLLRHAVTR